jgi:hypothetical protein
METKTYWEENMAKREAQVSEDKLQKLVDNWNTKNPSELARMLGSGESTINYWVGKLRKSMKSNGMTDEQIKKILPTKRKAHGNVYDVLVKKMLSSGQAPRRRGRKAKEVEGPVG